MVQRPVYRFDDFLADPETWRLTRSGQEIHVEPMVLRLLIYLIEHRGRLVPRQELMDTVWGDTVISDSALTKAVGRLRQALGDESAAPRYIETVHSQGYRFMAEVEEKEQPERPVGSVNRRAWYAGAAFIILVLAVLLWSRAPWHDELRDYDIQSLAVLPLSNLTGDPEQGYYVDGLQDILITELSRVPGLRVTSRQSTRRYRDSQKTATEIAGELGVDALVEGSLLRTGERIEVSVQLIHGPSDVHLWAERFARETPYIVDLISEIAQAIGTELRGTAAPPGSGPPAYHQFGPIDPRAIDAYSLGIMNFDRFTEEGIRIGIDQLETAVAIEPDFARAWGELGAAYAMQGMFGFAAPKESKEKFLAAGLRAIEADDQVAIGHAARGFARMYMGDFDSACESFAIALRLNPWDGYAIHGEADCLLFEGRTDESVARLRELQTISPFTAMHNIPLPSHLFMARRFDEAIIAATATQARIPRYSINWFLAQLYWELGRFDEALAEERLGFERRGDTVLLAALEEGLSADGPSGALRAVAESLVTRASESYVDPFEIAETFARAGSVDEALYWLERAVDYGSYKVTYIAFWPHLDALRDESRFQALMERVYGPRANEIIRQAASVRMQDR